MPQDLAPRALARITPARISPTQITPPRREAPVAVAASRAAPSPREKAAIIVRLLMAEGAQVPLASLPDHMQAALTEQIGQMRLIDRATLSSVVEEFLTELEEVGLSFPGGIDGAIDLMGDHISPAAASRLRRIARASGRGDPWERVMALPSPKLLALLAGEGTEVCAVVLSKLSVARAAELLGELPGDRARRVAFAMSLTANVDPETVRRIGQSLATQIDQQPLRAFETGPAERIGAILNITANATREQVLSGLESDDAGFAQEVRRKIFTFDLIPARLAPRDVPKVLRMVPQDVLITALAAAGSQEKLAPVTEFLLQNISQRLAQSLRDELEASGPVKEKEGEAAMTEIIAMIRQLEGAGELALIPPEDS